jgi:predicted acyltransferase
MRKSRSSTKLKPPSDNESRAERAVETPRAGDRKRLVSLDALRGLTILGMLLVNNVMLDTATPRQLRHAG